MSHQPLGPFPSREAVKKRTKEQDACPQGFQVGSSETSGPLIAVSRNNAEPALNSPGDPNRVFCPCPTHSKYMLYMSQPRLLSDKGDVSVRNILIE